MADKDIFVKGIENLKSIGTTKQFTVLSSFKFFFFYVYLCFLARCFSVDDRVFFKNGAVEKNRDDGNSPDAESVYVRRFSKNRQELKTLVSLPSLLNRKDRFIVLFNSMFNCPLGLKHLGRWFEYNLLTRAIENRRFEVVYTYGHYDEFVYWLTEVCRINNIRVEMYQHGVVLDNITIPNRVFYNTVHLFNEFSVKIFREYIVQNADCDYLIEGIRTSVSFEKIDKDSRKIYIGIIDQNNEKWDREVFDRIIKIDNSVGIVMLHPLNQSKYDDYDSERLIRTRKKYDNLDILIVENSTLVLDYIAHRYSGKIVCTDINAVNGAFIDYDLVYSSINDIDITIINLLSDRDATCEKA